MEKAEEIRQKKEDMISRASWQILDILINLIKNILKEITTLNFP